MSVWAIVLACGKDQEVSSGVDTAFLGLGERPVLAGSLQTLEHNSSIDKIVLVIKKKRVDATLNMLRQFACRKVVAIVAGQAQRHANLKKAYEQVEDDASCIVVHEASRPFVDDSVVTETVKAAKRYGAAVAAVRSADAVKFAEKGQKITHDIDRSTVWLAQSPQAFKKNVFEKILKSEAKLIDDESAVFEKTRQEIHLVVSHSTNMKIRTPEDLEIAIAMAGKIGH